MKARERSRQNTQVHNNVGILLLTVGVLLAILVTFSILNLSNSPKPQVSQIQNNQGGSIQLVVQDQPQTEDQNSAGVVLEII